MSFGKAICNSLMESSIEVSVKALLVFCSKGKWLQRIAEVSCFLALCCQGSARIAMSRNVAANFTLCQSLGERGWQLPPGCIQEMWDRHSQQKSLPLPSSSIPLAAWGAASARFSMPVLPAHSLSAPGTALGATLSLTSNHHHPWWCSVSSTLFTSH